MERPSWSKNNGDMVNKANKCDIVSEGVSLWHLCNYKEAELLIMLALNGIIGNGGIIHLLLSHP